MVPFDVMTGRNSMVCNSRGVADLCKSFEMLGLPVMQSSFCFADVEGITVPTTGFVYYFRSLRTTEAIFVRKKRLNPASVLKNDLKIDTAIELTNTRFNTSSKLLSHNPTKSRENSLISYLRNLKRDCIIDEATFRKILPCGSTAGVLYGLPKVHKTGCPSRPIVSSVNTYNYNLASFLVNVLKPISTNQFTIKDSFSFVDWAKTHQHNDEMTCSFDVCSLFTNVPLDETIEICLSKLYSLPDPPALPRHVLKTLLEFATKKSHFVFDGHYYDQIDGVAMGSPLGPVLANIFMCDFEQKWLTNVDSRPSIWFRYVDDTFSLFDSEATAASFLHFLNTRHPNIKFTMELEENQEIPFLDVRIKRNLNNFKTTVHRKTTFTGLYTKYKINLIRTLTYRCLRICSFFLVTVDSLRSKEHSPSKWLPKRRSLL